MSFRGNVLDALVAAGIAGVNANVYESFALPAPRTVPLPFLVVQVGSEQVDGPWQGVCDVLDVFVYREEGSFESVDVTLRAITAAINNKRFLDDQNVSCLVRASSTPTTDGFDPRWNALVDAVRFRVHPMAWLSAATYEPDPVTALQAWLHALYPALGYDPTLSSWSPSDAAPAVYFRVDREGRHDTFSWGTEVHAEIVAHVLAPSPQKTAEWVRRVAERLGGTKVIVLANGAWMRWDGPISAAVAADPFRAGQLRVPAFWRVRTADLNTADSLAGGAGGFLPPPVDNPLNHVYADDPNAGYPTPVKVAG